MSEEQHRKVRNIIRWQRIGCIVVKISETMNISLKEALDLFYKSETCRRFHDEETGLYLQGNLYVLNDFLAEISAWFRAGESLQKSTAVHEKGCFCGWDVKMSGLRLKWPHSVVQPWCKKEKEKCKCLKTSTCILSGTRSRSPVIVVYWGLNWPNCVKTRDTAC